MEGDLDNCGYSSRVQAVLDFFGPTDLFQIDKMRKIPRPETYHSPENKLIGGSLQDHADLARKANPITWVNKDDPPFLILHGDRDDTVPPRQSELLFEALKANGVPTEYHIIPGRGHGFRTGPDIDPIVQAFLDRYFPVVRR